MGISVKENMYNLGGMEKPSGFKETPKPGTKNVRSFLDY